MMSKLHAREQLGVRVSPEALDILSKLQTTLGREAGLQRPFSQSEAVEWIIRQASKILGKTSAAK